ncbi:MAG: hypothetical protein JXO48_06195 [Deltaproteobacteria bacterium]|nr:hypothetical protein [Deltaproteobacteria bacterium]
MEKEYQEIIEILQKIHPVHPPEYLVSSIMQEIQKRDTLLDRLGNIFRKPIFMPRNSSRASECGFCLFTAGFFFLVMGLVLTIGFKVNGLYSLVSGWFHYQPYAMLFTAAFFLVLSFIIVKGERRFLVAVKYAVFIFMSALVMNAVLLSPGLFLPSANFFVVAFTGTMFMMSFFILVSLERHQKVHNNE